MSDLAGHGDDNLRQRVPDTQPGEDVLQLSDAGLVESIARGSHDALAEAYSRHGANVHQQARRVGGDGGADDVVQDVFLRLWGQPERFDPTRGSLRSFLTMETQGRAIDALQRQRPSSPRNHDVHLPRRATRLRMTARSPASPDRAWRHLARLDHGERHAIALAYFGGHTYREVAVLLEQPEGTIKGRIRSGLRRLRIELDPKLDPSPTGS